MAGFFSNLFGITERRREKLRSRPFPTVWREFIQKNVPYYATLQDEDRRELEGHIQVFIDEKKFEGCGGLEMTDEIKVTIAAQACILSARKSHYYPALYSILVHPHAFVVKGYEELRPDTVFKLIRFILANGSKERYF